MTQFEKSVVERFWSKVDQSGECWLWTGGKFAVGYGAIRIRGKQWMAHRVSYEVAVGPIPQGLCLDHICHNRACVKPKHLRPVTRKQNAENLLGANRNNRSSGVRGVTWLPRDRRWQARVRHNRKVLFVGAYKTIAEAEAAVIAKRNELYTHNDIDRKAP